MSSDLPNPFAALSKKNFRKADGVSEKKSSVSPEVPSSFGEIDFATAVGNVSPVPDKGKGSRGKKSVRRSFSEQSFENEPLEAMEAFRGVKKLGKSKVSVKSKPSHEESTSRERSRQATANVEPKKVQSEEDAFFAAMQGVDTLSTKGGRDIAPEASSGQKVPKEDPAKALQDLLDGTIEFQLEFTEEYIQGHVEGLDPLTMGKLREGQYSPEGHLDMHGMIALEAYESLVEFMRTAYNKGKRTVLLIPGRGKNSPEGFSVLREKVQMWLTHDPFKRVVLAFCTAQPKDGGAGAIYVLLRKHKKSRGKIYWERTPSDHDLFGI